MTRNDDARPRAAATCDCANRSEAREVRGFAACDCGPGCPCGPGCACGPGCSCGR